MADPVTMEIPHKLGKDVAKARMEQGIGKLAALIPGGGVVDHAWQGDTMRFTLQAMGQRVESRMDVHDTRVHCEIDLPPFLALFAEKIRAKLAKEGPKLLE